MLTRRLFVVMLAVKEFARLTGDLPVLSTVDLRVLALTWMLEKECRGVGHLRTTPPPRAPVAPQRPRSVEAQADRAGAAGVQVAAGEAAAGEMTAGSAAGAGAMPGWPDEADGEAVEEGAEGDSTAEEAVEGEEGEGEIEEVIDDMPQRVLPGLYLGSLDAAQNHAALRARGVTHVLSVARELSQVGPLTPTPHPAAALGLSLARARARASARSPSPSLHLSPNVAATVSGVGHRAYPPTSGGDGLNERGQ